ncbi:MAG: c-type cytochrome [Dehalococcoidia bacterium]
MTAGEQVYAANCSSCHGEIGETLTLFGAPSHADDGHTGTTQIGTCLSGSWTARRSHR